MILAIIEKLGTKIRQNTRLAGAGRNLRGVLLTGAKIRRKGSEEIFAAGAEGVQQYAGLQAFHAVDGSGGNVETVACTEHLLTIVHFDQEAAGDHAGGLGMRVTVLFPDGVFFESDLDKHHRGVVAHDLSLDAGTRRRPRRIG